MSLQNRSPGFAKEIEGMAESTKGPAFLTCTGILLFALQKA